MIIQGIEMGAEFKDTRNGFAHIATAILPDGRMITNKVFYDNRTWERYTYETALHGLCVKVALVKFGCPSYKALTTCKKWEEANKFADALIDECDKKWCA